MTELKGIIFSELRLGVVASISASEIKVNLGNAGVPSATHFYGERYGRGEVGEFVIIEGQTSLILGRIIEVRLPERERHEIPQNFSGHDNLDAIGRIQLLGSITLDSLTVTTGVNQYPRLGDRVYSAPHSYLASLPKLVSKQSEKQNVSLTLGIVSNSNTPVVISPEKLFGRHCAILGSTGGGKSWTTARILEECVQYPKAKIILIDATSEYQSFVHKEDVIHCPLGFGSDTNTSAYYALPPNSFIESDFIALFEPSGKVQGPVMREAIRSLRLAKLCPTLAPNGIIAKANKLRKPIMEAVRTHADKLENPETAFDVTKLCDQIKEECVWPSPNNNYDESKWGSYNDSNYGYCLSLLTRIENIITSEAFKCIFRSKSTKSITEAIDEFISGKSGHKLLRICMSCIPFEYNAREIIANALARFLLKKARKGDFTDNPLVVFLDEAHHFLGRQIGSEDSITKLNAFELIAREGRKYGLNVCFATQRPRDITESVLSQIGTLIVHRLTNDRDREVVERACGEIDKSASAFLPNLKPGEASIIGIDFPIPITIQIVPPINKPNSSGPDYQQHWNNIIDL